MLALVALLVHDLILTFPFELREIIHDQDAIFCVDGVNDTREVESD